jgi:hypothetical protein
MAVSKITHVRQTDPGIDRELREIVAALNQLIDALGAPGSSVPADSSTVTMQAVNVQNNLYSLAVQTKDGMMYSLPGIFVKSTSIPQIASSGQTLKAGSDGNFSPQ